MASTYLVSTVLSEPFVMNKTDGSGFEGFMVDLISEVASRAGFKYQLQLAKDGKYGSRDQSARWSGMIGELLRREVDIAAADLTITAQRERVVEFSKPFLSQTARLLVNTPERPDTSLAFLLQAFSSEVWVCILCALFIVAILFTLIGRFNPYEWRQVPSDKDPRGARHSFGLRESLMFVFSTFTLQGYRETPKSLSGRILTVSWFIFVFLTIVAYIGIVVTFILSGNRETMPSMPFNDIDDLVNQTDIKVGVTKGSIYQKLSASKVPMYIRLFEMVSHPQSSIKDTQEGIERVRDSRGRFVMLIESLRGEYVTNSHCDLMMYGTGLFQSGLGLATPLRSKLRDKINLAILELREDGTIAKLRRKWWLHRSVCSTPKLDRNVKSQKTASALTLRSMAAPFLSLLVGAILSAIAFVGEIVFKKTRK